MITIQVKRNLKLPMKKDILHHAAQATLDLTNTPSTHNLSLIIGDDTLLEHLNSKYRQVDGPTDVLSFPVGEIDPDTKSMYLGDVIISLQRAEQQAAAGGHVTEDELQLLVVHGILHLLGFDHESFDDKQRMQAVQDCILDRLGLHLSVTL